MAQLGWEDLLVVLAYFVIIFAVGIYASFKSKKDTVSGFFLADRSMAFYLVGASMFVSNIGSEHFIGLAGSAASRGIGIAAWEFNALLFIQLLGFIFIPVYISSRSITMPEYMEMRFGGKRIRIYYAVLSLLLYVFTKCSVNLYTGALFIQQSLEWDMYLCIVIQLIIVAILNITGGLTAVIYTDMMQAILMVGGSLAMTIIAFNKIGGLPNLWRAFPLAEPNVTVPGTDCHKVIDSWDQMLKGPMDPDVPWPGFLFGQSPASIWYWCTDQVIVQRLLAAKNLNHAQGGALVAGFLKILPIFMMVFPGMIARVLYPNEVACVDPDICMKVCGSKTSCSNIAYPKLVLGIMPTGAKGLMMSVILAALMSDLDSIFNSASTLFTIDIYQHIRKKAGHFEIMIVSRLFIIVMAGLAIAWVPIVQQAQGGQLFIYIQEIGAYLAPPVAAVFLIGVFWMGCNEKGCFWGLMIGFVAGVIRLILVLVYTGPAFCGDVDTRPKFLSDFHYMYYALILFFLTIIVTIVVSLATKPPSYKQVYRTVFWTRYDVYDKKDLDNDMIEIEYRYLRCLYTLKRREAPVFQLEKVAARIQPPSTETEVYANGRENVAYHKNDDESTSEITTKEPSVDSISKSDSYRHVFKGDSLPEVEVKDKTWRDSKVARFVLKYICGLPDGELSSTSKSFKIELDGLSVEEQMRIEKEKEEEMMEKSVLKAMRQTTTQKWLLWVGLILVLSIAVFAYIFLSVWRWRP